MGDPESKPKVVLIVGPTASGKSALALRLAERQASTIVNADSAQVYRDVRVLSARPDAEELAQAPHALYGTVDGAEAYSAAQWADDAKAALAAAWREQRVPILVGGTGLYVRTLLDGIAPIPAIDPDIRAAVRAMPVAQAHAALVNEDPEAAARLNATDSTRIARALEVVRSTGKPLHEWQEHREGGIAGQIDLKPLILLPDREWLRARCDSRFAAMMEGGAVEEVEILLARNLSPDLPVMRAIGMREIAAMLSGEIGRAEATHRAQAATRQYAKRQYTWFRHQLPADWPRLYENDYIDDIHNIVI